MPLPNIFTKEVTDDVIARINKLTPESQRLWGKMDVARMLAHCNVAYETIYEPDKFPKPNFFVGLLLKTLVKRVVTSEKPYKHNNPTGPQFIIADERDFQLEKERLIEYIERTQQLGEDHFEGRLHANFGVMNKTGWNNMLYKHIDHHLTQFGT